MSVLDRALPRPRQGEDRRLRRGAPARALRRRPRRSTGTTTQLAERIGDYDAILIRSATKLTADLIARGEQPEGDRPRRRRRRQRRRRGGDQARHHRRQRAAVERHHRRRAHDGAAARARAQRPAGARARSSTARWERSKWGGVEVYEKTLGLLGFGRIGQLVAARAPGLRHARARVRPVRLGRRASASSASRRPSPPTTSTRRPTSSRSTCPRRPRPSGWLDAEALAKCSDGVRIINCARGQLVDDDALKAALDSGKVAGAALDVFTQRAGHRPPAVRLPQRRRHAAPRPPRRPRRRTAPACRPPSRSSPR